MDVQHDRRSGPEGPDRCALTVTLVVSLPIHNTLISSALYGLRPAFAVIQSIISSDRNFAKTTVKWS